MLQLVIVTLKSSLFVIKLVKFHLKSMDLSPTCHIEQIHEFYKKVK